MAADAPTTAAGQAALGFQKLSLVLRALRLFPAFANPRFLRPRIGWPARKSWVMSRACGGLPSQSPNNTSAQVVVKLVSSFRESFSFAFARTDNQFSDRPVPSRQAITWSRSCRGLRFRRGGPAIALCHWDAPRILIGVDFRVVRGAEVIFSPDSQREKRA